MENQLITNKYRWILFFFVASHFFLFFYLGISRHNSFLTSINDTGCFDQAIWSASKNFILYNTSIFSEKINWLGFHFHPILYFFVPFYLIKPSVYWLILSQSLAISLSALPIYLISAHINKSEKYSFLWTVIYLLNPYLTSANTWDFHPITLATPFITLSLLAIIKKNNWLLFFSCLIILLCKEQTGFIVTGLGILHGIYNKNLKIGLTISLIGIVITTLVLSFIMPELSNSGSHIMFTDRSDHLSRYNWLGNSFTEVVINIITKPYYIFDYLVNKLNSHTYWFQIILVSLIIPIFKPLFILPALPDILINSLSTTALPRSILSYHSCTIPAFTTTASIIVLKKYATQFSLFKINNIILMNTGFIVIISWLLAPFPLPYSINFWEPKQYNLHIDKNIYKIKNIIKDQSISIQSNIGSHFTHRKNIYRFPNKTDSSDYIILKINSPTTKNKLNSGEDVASLAHHLQMNPFDYLDKINEIIHSKKYDIVYWNDQWLVLKKITTPYTNHSKLDFNTKNDITNFITQTKLTWHTEKILDSGNNL